MENSNNEINELDYFNSWVTENSLVIRKWDGEKCGIANHSDNSIIIPCVYDSLKFFPNSEIIVAEKNNKFGCFDKQLNELLPCEFDSYSYIFYSEVEEIISFRIEDYETYASHGKVISGIKGGYANIRKFKYLIISKDGKYGIIDRKCNIVYPFVFDKSSHDNYKSFNEQFFVERNGLTGVLKIDSSTIEESIPCEYTVYDKINDNSTFSLPANFLIVEKMEKLA